MGTLPETSYEFSGTATARNLMLEKPACFPRKQIIKKKEMER